jgi:hypothetical protein
MMFAPAAAHWVAAFALKLPLPTHVRRGPSHTSPLFG